MAVINKAKWLHNNTENLKGKTVAVTGSTGGIGGPLCFYLAKLGANLILLDRNLEKSQNFGNSIKEQFPQIKIEFITVDLSSIQSVKSVSDRLKAAKPDIFIHNAGAYCIPKTISDTGYNNIFQINFVSPYFMIKELLPVFRQNGGRAVVVGSIAHNYSKIDVNDIDFSTRRAASLIYGNAKRYLMFSLFELFKNEKTASLSIVHPGITFTNITAHYPKLIFAVIKHPMKVIFMKPKTACLSIVKGVFADTGYNKWFGPRFFGIWGKPKLSKLKTCKQSERAEIFRIAEEIYNAIKNTESCIKN